MRLNLIVPTVSNVSKAIIALILSLFTVRRWVLTLVALRSPSQQPVLNVAAYPPLLVLSAVRNEMANLPTFLARFSQLIYPTERLLLAIVDDGSTDATPNLLAQWEEEAENRLVITLSSTHGKAEALNQALDHIQHGVCIAVFDADEHPASDTLLHLMSPFADKQVGAVTGRRLVANPSGGMAATYVTFEYLVHQHITCAAKDRLRLAPPVLGSNCAYRRKALEAVGGFRPNALLEDSDITVRLAQAGWKLRYTPHAVSTHIVPTTLRGYWRQHSRWARGFADISLDTPQPARSISPLLRLELAIFSLGYLDRLAVVVGGLFAFQSRWIRWLVVTYLVTPLFQIVCALHLTNTPPALWLRLPLVPFFFVVDIAMAVNGWLQALRRAPRHWESREARP